MGIACALFLLIGLDIYLMPRYSATGAAIGQLGATAFLGVFMAASYMHYLRTLANNKHLEV